MRLFVIGANGLVGSALVATATAQGHEVAGTYHSERPSFDVALDQHDIREWPPSIGLNQFDAVVNCAAMTDVDGCERNPELAQAINATAPREIARSCKQAGVAFVHLSTDYIFDGRADSPYDETTKPNPLQEYGKSKLRGEQHVRSVSDHALVLRLSFVYGIHGATGELTGFPAWVTENLRDSESIPLFTDQHVTPSRAGQVAGVILELLGAGASGTFHVASQSCVTPFEFGALLADQMGVERRLLDEGSRTAVNRPAARPADTCLSTARLEAELGRPQPTLAEDIDAIADALS